MAYGSAVRGAARRIGGAFARGYGWATGGHRYTGWAGQVSPFAPGTVTPGAVALKSLASIIYGQRAREAARAQQNLTESNMRYRDAQTRVLEQKLNAQPEPMTSITLPGGMTIPVTRKELLAHPQLAGQARVHIAAETAKALGPFLPQTYDPTTGTIPQNELNAAHQAWATDAAGKLHKAIQDRLDQQQARLTGRSQALTALQGTKAMLDQMDKETKAAGEARATLAQQVIAKHVAILNDPKATPDQKTQSAKYLELSPMRNSTDGSLLNVNGQPVYDTESQTAQAHFKTLVAQWQHFGELAHRTANASQRAQLTKTYAEQAGAAGLTPDGTPEPVQADDGLDQLEQAAQEFIQHYNLTPVQAGQPASQVPTDTSEGGPDQPAEEPLPGQE